MDGRTGSGDANVEVMAEAVAMPVDSSVETAEKYKAKLKSVLKNKSDMFEDMVQHEEVVRLGEDGWKSRYYEQKFGITDPAEQAELAKKLSHAYVEGLCWVMRYYFDGVASWTWYYPFHYAPFASDLVDLADLKVRSTDLLQLVVRLELSLLRALLKLIVVVSNGN